MVGQPPNTYLAKNALAHTKTPVWPSQSLLPPCRLAALMPTAGPYQVLRGSKFRIKGVIVSRPEHFLDWAHALVRVGKGCRFGLD